MAAELAIKITADGKAVVTAAKQAETALQGIDAQAGKTSQALQGTSHSSEGLEAAMRALQASSQGYVAQLAASKSQIDSMGAQLAAVRAEVDQLKEKLARPAPVLPGVAPGLDKIGISAKQTAAALRGVPAQFTDIVTSLQGGQAPLTVFLQQGGQLKDMFGGAGNAAKALGGYVLGLVNPFTVGAAVALGLAVAYEKGAGESRAFQNAVTLSGNAVGLSSSQFAAMTQSIASVTGTRGAAAAALTEIASTGRLAGTQIEAIGTAAVLMQKATGQAVSDTVAQFVKLADEPVKASLELNKQYNYLTAAVYTQIKALEEQGNKLGAAELAEKTYADAIKARASTVIDNAGLMERAWRGITGAAKGAWDAMLNVGREASLAQKLAAVSAEIEKGKGAFNPSAFGDGNAEARAKLQMNIALQASLQEQVRLEKRGTEAANERGQATQRELEAKVTFGRLQDQFATNADKRKKEIAIARREGLAAGQYTAEILLVINGIEDKYKDKVAARGKAEKTTGETELASIRARVIETQRYIDTMKSQGLEAAKQTEGEKLVVKIQQELEGSLKGVARANKEKSLSAALSLASIQKESAALEALMKAQRDFEKDRDKEIAGQEVSILKMEEKALAMEDQVRMYGMSQEAIESLSIARLQERADILAGFTGSEEQVALIEKEIAARKRLALATDGKDALDAGLKAAKEADAEWKRTATSIENTLTESLMRAFEGGKGFAQAMRDTIVSMFKTMILRPIIQAVMSPVSSAIGSVLGMPGAANVTMGGLSSLSSLVNIGSSIGTGITQTVANLLPASLSASLGMTSSALMASNAALAGGGASGMAAASAAAAAGNGAALGGMGASMTTALAAIPVWGWVALGTAAVGAMLMGKGDSRFGSQYQYTAGSGTAVVGGPNAGVDFGGMSSVSTSTAAGIDLLLEKLGSASRVGSLSTGFESSEKGKGFSYAGGVLSTGQAFGQGSDGLGWQNNRGSMNAEQAQASYIQELKQSTLQALQAATDIPASISKTLAGVNIDALTTTALDQLITTVDAQVIGLVNFKTTLELLPFKNLTGLSLKAADALAVAAGGIEALSGNLSSYYDSFYSDAEKRAQTIQNINAATAGSGLNAATATRASYRALVEAQDVTTESGQKTYAAMMSAAGAFASITSAVDAVASSRTDLIDAYKNEASAMQSTVDKFRSFAGDLRSFRDGLLTGGLSPLTPGQRYAQTSNQFDKLVAATNSGTEAERSAAIGKLQGASTALLEASKMYNASSGAYVMDFDRVQEALSGAAISALATADVAQLQLDAAKSQLTALGEIDKSVLSVSSAIAALAAAQVAAGTAGALPAFANGGVHSGGWAMVGERGPELAYMPPARIYTAADTSRMMGGQGGTSDILIKALLQQVVVLTQRVEQLTEQQSQETSALIQSNYDANAKNAQVITTHQSKKAWSTEPALS